jgi:SAM-dependent methyltransferase
MEDLLQLMKSELPSDALGVEIGAHCLPVPGINPYYVDRVNSFAGADSQIDIQADGAALPFPTGELDYLCSSHVLEHLVNPIAGLLEWHRVLRLGGLLYLVVPDKRFTFDEPRPLTRPSHIIDDFAGMTEVTEREHVREFIFHTDWKRLHPEVKADDIASRQQADFQAYISEIERGRAVDIHHHTFTPESLQCLFSNSGLLGGDDPSFALEAAAENFPEGRGDGIGVLLRKVGRVEELQEAETFAFASSVTPKRAIRLVCPATLAALKRTTVNHTLDRLEVAGFNHSFVFRVTVPILLPPENVPVQRVWNNYTWRRKQLSKAVGEKTKHGP